MRFFAKLFIILYLLDGGLSLIDELLATATVTALTELRYLVASLVLLLALPLYATLGIDKRLKKRVFVPLIVFILWCDLGLWPLAGFFDRAILEVAAAVGQTVLGVYAVLALRSRDSSGILLPKELFQSPFFSWRNTLTFTAVNLCLLPFAALFFGMATASLFLEEQTSGFMRLSPLGIYMTERTYHLDHKVVRLAGMMHIGNEAYYQDLAGSVPVEGTIILAEGVTDRDHLLQSQFSYGKLAGVLGLSAQETLKFDGHLVDLDDPEPLRLDQDQSTKPDIAVADVDLNSFNPKTIEFLNVLGNTLLSGAPLKAGLQEYNAWVNAHMTPEWIEIITDDILINRNVEVVRRLVMTLKDYDTIVIPWGAMHMPEIEAAVIKQGFLLAKTQERLSLDFRTLPYASFLKYFTENNPQHRTIGQ